MNANEKTIARIASIATGHGLTRARSVSVARLLSGDPRAAARKGATWAQLGRAAHGPSPECSELQFAGAAMGAPRGSMVSASM